MKYGVTAFGVWLVNYINSINDLLSALALTLSILVSIVGLYRQLKTKDRSHE